jgi:hypothetical protein
MLHLDEPQNIGTIILCGDHHGKYEWLVDEIKRNHIDNALIIHVGDGSEGLDWFTKKYVEIINEFFKERNIHYWSVRGNHSNPALFDGSWMWDHFKLLPDHSRAKLFGQTWHLTGGAISINRSSLEMHKNWWPDEEFKLPDQLPEPCDVLITHAGPTFTKPIRTSDMIKHYHETECSMNCTTLIKELEAESLQHNRLGEMVKPKHWYHGHLHQSIRTEHDGCEILCLGEQELREHRV